MNDIVNTLRAASSILLGCPEHVQIEGRNALVNLHKRADEVIAAAKEIERMRLTDEEREAVEAAARIIDSYEEEMDGFPSGASATLRGLLERLG